uniref:Uncharacterized protein n=1 Tax=Chromera velia CCMP2878 TaxID=1169474 RepID=A0A0G4H7M4_9ALVE|eukprot:Cvel_25013.t1-p1 / transcript=Cvel_25013.t1 / gene=Cvel_25013 / organism=Chromera_velia_CCMP2878 / gene_product=hypothetical protein / transcript_product=hypothetical protein / location=Cvel_scaffold2773:6889-8464(+) / protein_length=430 / sequence_SO=supercontig / SO=protein_coding / is_pseudo=false
MDVPQEAWRQIPSVGCHRRQHHKLSQDAATRSQRAARGMDRENRTEPPFSTVIRLREERAGLLNGPFMRRLRALKFMYQLQLLSPQSTTTIGHVEYRIGGNVREVQRFVRRLKAAGFLPQAQPGRGPHPLTGMRAPTAPGVVAGRQALPSVAAIPVSLIFPGCSVRKTLLVTPDRGGRLDAVALTQAAQNKVRGCKKGAELFVSRAVAIAAGFVFESDCQPVTQSSPENRRRHPTRAAAALTVPQQQQIQGRVGGTVRGAQVCSAGSNWVRLKEVEWKEDEGDEGEGRRDVDSESQPQAGGTEGDPFWTILKELLSASSNKTLQMVLTTQSFMETHPITALPGPSPPCQALTRAPTQTGGAEERDTKTPCLSDLQLPRRPRNSNRKRARRGRRMTTARRNRKSACRARWFSTGGNTCLPRGETSPPGLEG